MVRKTTRRIPCESVGEMAAEIKETTGVSTAVQIAGSNAEVFVRRAARDGGKIVIVVRKQKRKSN
jgi:hypothetical protein